MLRGLPCNLKIELIYFATEINTVAVHLRAPAINPKSDLFTRQFTK